MNNSNKPTNQQTNKPTLRQRKLSLLLEDFCNKAAVKAKPMATELKEIIKSKADLPSSLSKSLQDLFSKEIYSALEFRKNSATVECEKCHSQELVSEEIEESEKKEITVEPSIAKVDLTDILMYCKNCDSRQNHSVIASTSDENFNTNGRIKTLIEQISSAAFSEKGTSRKSAPGFQDGGDNASASSTSLARAFNA